jgi:hypothetical protein
VLNRARTRRYRRLTTFAAVTGVFLSGVWGGLAMAGGVTGVQSRLVSLANRTGDLVSPDQQPTDRATTGAAGVAASKRQPPTSDSGTPTASPSSSERPAMIRGLVVDGAGAPVEGMYVYIGTGSGNAFTPRATPTTVTNQQGHYAVPCSAGPVLLTPWLLNYSRGAIAPGHWAATYVTSPRCSHKVASTVTMVKPGASLAGHVSTDHRCPDSDFALSLWLGGNRLTAMWLTNLNEGDDFQISGLPRGAHVLRVQGRHIPITIVTSGRATQNVIFTCPDLATPTGAPTTIPVLPTPTETPTPDPSSSPTATGTPTPTSSGG